MCGIIGYLGPKKVEPILIKGLKRLEYRGYDSAGVSLMEHGKIHTIKKTGKVSTLEKLIDKTNFNTSLGIAHTRWATHGAPNDINAHPHNDQSGKISLVHNGIIENHDSLRQLLESKNIKFSYRQINLPKNLIFLSASFKTKKEDKKYIEEKIIRLKEKKDSSQPLRVKTGGSTFKNPKNKLEKKVWELIKENVDNKISFGDAKISEKHSNFFINTNS